MSSNIKFIFHVEMNGSSGAGVGGSLQQPSWLLGEEQKVAGSRQPQMRWEDMNKGWLEHLQDIQRNRPHEYPMAENQYFGWLYQTNIPYYNQIMAQRQQQMMAYQMMMAQQQQQYGMALPPPPPSTPTSTPPTPALHGFMVTSGSDRSKPGPGYKYVETEESTPEYVLYRIENVSPKGTPATAFDGKLLYAFRDTDGGNIFFVAKNEELDVFELIDMSQNKYHDSPFEGNDRIYITNTGKQMFYYRQPVPGVPNHGSGPGKVVVIDGLRHGHVILPYDGVSSVLAIETDLYHRDAPSFVSSVSGMMVWPGAGGAGEGAGGRQYRFEIAFSQPSSNKFLTGYNPSNLATLVHGGIYPSVQSNGSPGIIYLNPLLKPEPVSQVTNLSDLFRAYPPRLPFEIRHDPGIPEVIPLSAHMGPVPASASAGVGEGAANASRLPNISGISAFLGDMERRANLDYAIYGGQAIEYFRQKYAPEDPPIVTVDYDINISTPKGTVLTSQFSYLRSSVVNMINLGRLYYEHFGKAFLDRNPDSPSEGGEYYINLFVTFYEEEKMMQYIWNLVELQAGFDYETVMYHDEGYIKNVQFRNRELRTRLRIQRVDQKIPGIISVISISMMNKRMVRQPATSLGEAPRYKQEYLPVSELPEMDFSNYPTLHWNNVYKAPETHHKYYDPVFLLLVLMDLMKKYSDVARYEKYVSVRLLHEKRGSDEKRYQLVALKLLIPFLIDTKQITMYGNKTKPREIDDAQKSVFMNIVKRSTMPKAANDRNTRSRDLNRSLREISYNITDTDTIFTQATEVIEGIQQAVASTYQYYWMGESLRMNMVEAEELAEMEARFVAMELVDSLLLSGDLQSPSALKGKMDAPKRVVRVREGEEEAEGTGAGASAGSLPLRLNQSASGRLTSVQMEEHQHDAMYERLVEDIQAFQQGYIRMMGVFKAEIAGNPNESIQRLSDLIPSRNDLLVEGTKAGTRKTIGQEKIQSTVRNEKGKSGSQTKGLVVETNVRHVSGEGGPGHEGYNLITRLRNRSTAPSSFNIMPVTNRNYQKLGLSKGEVDPVCEEYKKRFFTRGGMSFIYPVQHAHPMVKPYLEKIDVMTESLLERICMLIGYYRKAREAGKGWESNRRSANPITKYTIMMMVTASVLYSTHYIADNLMRETPLFPGHRFLMPGQQRLENYVDPVTGEPIMDLSGNPMKLKAPYFVPTPIVKTNNRAGRPITSNTRPITSNTRPITSNARPITSNARPSNNKRTQEPGAASAGAARAVPVPEPTVASRGPAFVPFSVRKAAAKKPAAPK